MTTKMTGLRRRHHSVQRRFNATRAYHAPDALLPICTVLQPVLRIHDQPVLGSCGGEAVTGRIEPHVNVALSGVDTWTDARRRQGDLNNPDTGTDSEHIYPSVTLRGVSPYTPGEEYRSAEDLRQITPLDQELQADARRIDVGAVHRTIDTFASDEEQLHQLNDALQRDYACTLGTGCNAEYQRLCPGDVADSTTLDGALPDGHLEGVIGMVASDDVAWPEDWRGCLFIQNSWSENWGGVTLPIPVTLTNGETLPTGTVLRGVIRARPSCYTTAWEHDTIEVRIAV